MAIQTYTISFADRIYLFLSLAALQIVLLSFANPCSYLVTSMDFLKDEQICRINIQHHKDMVHGDRMSPKRKYALQ